MAFSAHHHPVDGLKIRDDKVAAERCGVAQREDRQEQPGVEVHLLQQHRQLSRPIPRPPLQLLCTENISMNAQISFQNLATACL